MAQVLWRGAALAGDRSVQHRLGDICVQGAYAFQTGMSIGTILKVSESVFLCNTVSNVPYAVASSGLSEMNWHMHALTDLTA